MLPLVFYSETDGPFTSKGSHNGYPTYNVHFLRKRIGFRQKKPYNIPTRYSSVTYRLLSGQGDSSSWSWSADAERILATNQARQRFVNKLGDSSSLGATLTAEGSKTWSMFVSVVTRIGLAAKYVRRGALFQAAEVLGLPYRERLVTRKRNSYVYVSRKNGLGRRRVRVRREFSVTRVSWGTGREYAHSAASGWLMFSYGIKPLVTDAYNAMDFLVREQPDSLISGTGFSSREWRYVDPNGYKLVLYKAVVRVRVQAHVRVSNPNLWLANKLGLINPVQWINEAVPFSFVVDWFSNLSQIIMQMTDFVGLDIRDPCTNTVEILHEQTLALHENVVPFKKEQYSFKREITMPSAKLVFKYERFQWQRGLNAISLLTVLGIKKS